MKNRGLSEILVYICTMKIKIITLVLLSTSFFVKGQSTKSYGIVNLKGVSSRFDSSLKAYTLTVSHDLRNHGDLDSMARRRALYYLGLMKFGSRETDMLDLYYKIPHSEIAHSRYFGLPEFFKESPGTIYPESLGGVKNIEIKAEILQESMTTKISQNELSDEKISQIAMDKMERAHGRNYIIDGYKGSSSHNSIILSHGHGKYGTATMGLISESYDPVSKEWKYEFFVVNCTVFTQGQ